MNGKSMAAIALIIIVAVPLMAGYALNTHSHEKTTFETDKSYNISDWLLNAQTDYFDEFYGYTNNSELLLETTYPVTEYLTVSPDYKSVGSTYTSLKEYETSIETVTLEQWRTHTVSWNNSGGASLNHVGQYDEILEQISDGYVTVTTDNPTVLHWTLLVYDETFTPTSYSIDVTNPIHVVWAYPLRIDVPGTGWVAAPTGAELIGDVPATVTGAGRDLTSLQAYDGVDFSFTAAPNSLVRIDHGNDHHSAFDQYEYWIAPSSGYNPVVHSLFGNVWIDDHLYSDVTRVWYASVTESSIQISQTEPTGRYQDPAYGWSLPSQYSSYAPKFYWLNGTRSNGVDFMIAATGDATLYATAKSGETTGTTLTITYSNGIMRFNGQNLGAYDKALLHIGQDSATLSGIAAWPAMGYEVDTLNSLTVTYAAAIDLINQVELNSDHVERWNLRVDQTIMLAGQFPSTINYTLNMGSLIPEDRALNIKLNSIGVYGDSISIAGVNFAVTDGTITVNDHKVALRGAMIQNEPGQQGFNTVKINDEVIVDHYGGIAPIFFAGEWSLTATAYEIVGVTQYVHEWIAGGFGLDKNGIIAAALATAAAVFIGLGLTGSRSGGKVLWLGLACGGMALGAIILI